MVLPNPTVQRSASIPSAVSKVKPRKETSFSAVRGLFLIVLHLRVPAAFGRSVGFIIGPDQGACTLQCIM